MTSKVDLDWHNMLFDLRRSIRYHHRRRAFFDRLDMSTNMLSVIFGSAAVYGVLEQQYKMLALVAAGTVTVASAVNLVLGSAQRARAHSDFVRRYIQLERRMQVAVPDAATLVQVRQDRLAIEAEEPPVLHVLNVICHNEEMRAMGYPKANLAKIRWWQRLFANITDVREDLIHA